MSSTVFTTHLALLATPTVYTAELTLLPLSAVYTAGLSLLPSSHAPRRTGEVVPRTTAGMFL